VPQNQEESQITIDEKSQLVIDKGSMMQAGIGVESMDVDDEMVLYDTLRNQSYRLNAAATTIWRLLKEGPTFGQLVEHSAPGADSSASSREMEEALPGFLTELADRGLIGIVQPTRSN
jgi:hypothetical protein